MALLAPPHQRQRPRPITRWGARLRLQLRHPRALRSSPADWRCRWGGDRQNHGSYSEDNFGPVGNCTMRYVPSGPSEKAQGRNRGLRVCGARRMEDGEAAPAILGGATGAHRLAPFNRAWGSIAHAPVPPVVGPPCVPVSVPVIRSAGLVRPLWEAGSHRTGACGRFAEVRGFDDDMHAADRYKHQLTSKFSLSMETATTCIL